MERKLTSQVHLHPHANNTWLQNCFKISLARVKKKRKNWIATLQKNQIGLVSHTVYRDKLKWTKDLNVISETIIFLEKNIKRCSDIILNCICLVMSPQARETKAQINKRLYQTKNLLLNKGRYHKNKNHLPNGSSYL